MSRHLPTSMTRVNQLLLAVVALGAVAVALVVVLEDQLVRSWAEGKPELRRTLAEGGVEAVRNGAVQPPAFVPVSIVLFLVVAGLLWVLGIFLRAGYEWARLSVAVLVVLSGISVVAGIRTDPPAVFVVFSVAALVLLVVLLVYLFHPQTTAYLRSPGDERDEDPRPSVA